MNDIQRNRASFKLSEACFEQTHTRPLTSSVGSNDSVSYEFPEQENWQEFKFKLETFPL